MIKSSRKIKCLGDCVKEGDKFLHPITLQIKTNSSKGNKCPTELYLGDMKYYEYTECNLKHDKIKSNEIQKFMALPYLNLNLDIMLSIYKIDTVDSLIQWINNMIEEDKPFRYVNRIINIWIKSNYDNLLKNNKVLVDVYLTINKHYWKKKNIEISDFLKKWFKIKEYDDFNHDLGIDLLHELNKKNI